MNLWGVESVHLFFFKAGEKSNDLVLEENQRLPTTAWNVSSFNFIYLFILPSCFNPWSLKAKNECNVLENEEHVTVSKKETKGKGVCVLGSLVRRHIKAIQLIDEAFHKWRVKVCMSLFICLFFFFKLLSLSLFHLPLLSYHASPVVVSSHRSHLTLELEGMLLPQHHKVILCPTEDSRVCASASPGGTCHRETLQRD